MLKEKYHIAKKITQRISAQQAFHYRIVPIDEVADVLLLKTDQENIEMLGEELQIVLDTPVRLSLCSSEEIRSYLSANYRQAQDKQKSSLHYSSDFLEKIIYTAKEIGSSDVHFEPYETTCRVRYRLDGKLLEQYHIPLEEYPTIINKIKIKADLDIAEKRLPQDGRITLKSAADEFDLRVSTLPTLFGEKIVLRILSKDSSALDLNDLGFTSAELNIFKESIKIPNGIILISGPTGSGKTTTLYATLKLLNDDKTNILTIEDPIEYTLEGVNQVQLRENIGLGFASALRTFLRQDPDIIMVGEIRDVKTANMAIRAALTGHLVLSTIHTNSAWATISRLIDMGVPPFLIASTLNISVAQRLVRKLCSHCKAEKPITPNIFPDSFTMEDLHFRNHWIPVGCPHCHHTGYKGRKAIYEIIPITKSLVLEIKENATHIDEYLKENEIRTLQLNAISLIKTGVTSVHEVYSLLTN